MFRNRFFVLAIVALLAFSSFAKPVLAAPQTQGGPEIAYTISGNAGVAGAVLSWDDAGAHTTTADSNGDYIVNVTSGWSGTITPALSGYEFTPPDRSYTSVGADTPGEDYTITVVALTPTITNTPSNTPTFTSTATRTRAATTTSTATATYTATITRTPSNTATETRTATKTKANTKTPTRTKTSTRTFTPTKTTSPTITQTASKSPTPTTPSGFSKIYPWNGVTNISYSTITLSWTNYSPTPSKYRYCIDLTNDNECTLSQGYTSTSGRSITFSNFTPGTTYYWHVQAVTCLNSSCSEKKINDSNSGNWWSFTTAAAPTSTPTVTATSTATFTRTPTKTATPTSTLTPTPVKFSISGNAGVAGATLSYTDGSAKTATADGSGAYSFKVNAHWAGTVTVSRSGYTFSTSQRNYSNVMVDKTNQNYTPDQVIHTISGNTGTSGVTLSFNDGAAQTTTSNSAGDYSVLVPDNWTGSVTPSKSGTTFTPTNHSYSSLTSDQSGQDFTPTTTFLSLGAQDGWVLESTETSGLGGTMNSAATAFQLGDDASNRQYRAILSFSTGSLPDNATIQSAVLKIKQNGTSVGVSPFTVLGSLLADIRMGSFGAVALELTDFNATAAGLAGTFGSTPVSGWYSMTLNATGRGYINRTGGTQFRLRFGTDDNDNSTDNYMKFISGDFASSQPQLIITYTVP